MAESAGSPSSSDFREDELRPNLPSDAVESQQLRNAFLSGLPSFKQDNFTRFTLGGGGAGAGGGSCDGGGSVTSTGFKPSSRRGRPSLYVCTKDYHAEQVITTEKTNILLRYLHKQWDRKSIHVKRGAEGSNGLDDDGDDNESGSPTAVKISRVEHKSP